MNRFIASTFCLLCAATALAKSSHAHASSSSGTSDDSGGCIAICLFGTLGLIFAIYKLATRAGPTGLLRDGLIGRGILLRVDIPLTRWSAEGGRQLYQRRKLRIDVEVPGSPPYEVDTWVQFPTNLSRLILPGATVELRVDKKDRNKVVISGPGVALGASFFNPALQTQTVRSPS